MKLTCARRPYAVEIDDGVTVPARTVIIATGAAYRRLETSLPGVFAVGDVRGGDIKRVASAVGEGAIAVAFVHRVLAE